MTDPLEDDVREALHRKAKSVPDQATERLCSTDYNPRSASWQQVRAFLASLTRAVRRRPLEDRCAKDGQTAPSFTE